MANLFGNLLDKDNPVKKIQKEIENTEFKKQSLIAPLQNEINVAKQKINQRLYQIGKEVHEGHMSGEGVGDRLTPHFDEIASLNVFIGEKETKIKEFSTRYDEELTILQANLSLAGAPQAAPQTQAYTGAGNAAAPAGSGAFCVNCGRPFTPGEDLFCMGCGQKLS